MPKIVRFILLLVLAVLVIESLSSYLLYRYHSHRKDRFQPTGFATEVFMDEAVSRLIHPLHVLHVSADHMPLFSPSPDFGYVMNPGKYEITELYKEHRHKFHLTVDANGRRTTSYSPVHASHRIFLTGDSAVFGWGLNDPETIGWLLQERFPSYEVINMSATGYSTVDALAQLTLEKPVINAGDIVIVPYHPVSNEFNVLPQKRLESFPEGYEVALGASGLLSHGMLSFGVVDRDNAFSIRKIKLSCSQKLTPDCIRPSVSEEDSQLVTVAAVDRIASTITGRLLVAFLEGPDDDPVIRRLRANRIAVADLRTPRDDQEPDDEMPTNTHSGAFRHYNLFLRMASALSRAALAQVSDP